jgi:hypothetical protein
MPSSKLPGTVDDATAELESAEARLGAVLGEGPGARQGAAAVQPADAGAAPTPAEARPAPTAKPETHADAAPEGDSDSQCKNACDALASLLRAVDHVCDLAGREDERCLSAKGRGDRARARVSASCSECAP